MTATNFTFLEVKMTEGPTLYTSGMSGILGLGYESIAYENMPIFLNRADTEDRSFSVALRDYLHDSYMVMPGTDEELYEGELVYHDVALKKLWITNVSSISAGPTPYD